MTLNLRINRKIRIPKVHVINENGEQIRILTLPKALTHAEQADLDLVN